MSESVSAFGSTFLSGVWSLFSVQVPGFNFTFAQFWIGVAVCSLSIVVFKFLLGMASHGSSSRTSSTDKPKISNERKDDEF